MPLTLRDLDRWFHPSFLQRLLSLYQPSLTQPPHLSPSLTTPPQNHPPLLDDDSATPEPSTTGVVSSVDPTVTLNKTVLNGSAPSATSLPPNIFLLLVLPGLASSPGDTPLPTTEVPLTLKSEVAPQMYNRGNVTEIPFVDESSEWELLSLLGDWYEPESFESIFSSIASDAVFFSS